MKGKFFAKINGIPVEVYAASAEQAKMAKEYIEKTLQVPDLSPEAQAARMANALHEAQQRDKERAK